MSEIFPRASRRINNVQPPIIPIVSQLIQDNPGTISLGQGVVYYNPPEESFKQLAQLENAADLRTYGPSRGHPELLKFIQDKLQTENGIKTNKNRTTIVTAGANMAFLNTILAISDPGDEIILNTPYYFNHEMAVRIADCIPKFVATNTNYQLQIDKLSDAINDKTRAIVTVSPNNPTGAIYPESALREVNQLCAEHGLFHISDEAYEDFIFDDSTHFSPAAIETASEHTISLFSLSKSYGFANWRMGYMNFPRHLEEAVIKIQDTNLICPPLASQFAAIGAMHAGKQYPQQKLGLIKEIREKLLKELSGLADFCEFPLTSGAFYLFVKINTELSAMEVVEYLIKQHKIAVIPGHTFGMSDACYIRVSYGALEKDSAAEGIQRLIHGLTALKNNNI